MNTSKIIKTMLFVLVYGLNLFFSFGLWFCGLSGNIMLGILFIIVYRLSLWFSPLMVTVICWLPFKPVVPVYKKLIFNLVHLILCGVLFLNSYLWFGNWY
ncbi:MAG: hypothetical protein E7614_08035 [Ruminococcaceae bacterium]|nr:hypothetical protein [Oscillospiraceae bacterium]